MSDYMIRATALDGQVRAFAVSSTNLVENLRSRHGTWPTATAAMGRTVSGGAMMGAMLKDGQSVTVQVQGEGPIGQIVVDANAQGKVRGYVANPLVDFPLNEQGKLDVAGAVGREGFLHVIKDLGLKDPYSGSVPLVSGELAEDFTYYFAKSEQTPSAVALGVLVDRDTSVKAAGGFIIQLMPGVADDDIARIEQAISNVRPVSAMLDDGLTPEQMLETILPELRVLERLPLEFQCRCSHERVRRMLVQLGADELDSMINEDGGAEVVCHFCNEKYMFNQEELEQILSGISEKD